MEQEYSYYNKNENGDYGYESNDLGMYDWYVVGGRWENALPKLKSEKEFKKIIDKALKKLQKENNLLEFIKISEMSTKKACAYLCLGGQNIISIGEFSFDELLDWFEHYLSTWSNDKNKDIISRLFSTILIETEDEKETFFSGDEKIGVEFLREKYEYYKKINLETGRNIFMSALDLHS